MTKEFDEDLQLELVEIEPQKTNEEKIQELLKRADLVLEKVRARKMKKVG